MVNQGIHVVVKLKRLRQPLFIMALEYVDHIAGRYLAKTVFPQHVLCCIQAASHQFTHDGAGTQLLIEPHTEPVMGAHDKPHIGIVITHQLGHALAAVW